MTTPNIAGIALPRSWPSSVKIPEAAFQAFFCLLDFAAASSTVLAVHAAYHAIYIGGPLVTSGSVAAGLLIAFLFCGILLLRGAYTSTAYLDVRQSLRSAAIAWCCAFFILGWMGFLLKVTEDFSRASLSAAFGVGLIVLLAVRSVAARRTVDAINRQFLVLSRVFIIHDMPQSQLDDFLLQLREQGAQAVGCYALTDIAPEQRFELGRHLQEVFSRQAFDEVQIAISWRDRDRIRALLSAARHLPVRVTLWSDPTLSEFLHTPHNAAGPHAAFEVQKPPLSPAELGVKGLLDVTLAFTGLFLLSPLLIGAAVAVRLETSGPVIFRQQRKGFGSKPFTIYKLRTMSVMEDGDVITQATRGDVRITKVGAFLRRTSIDEIPQLWNVLRGDMSLVGPRPHAIAHDTHYDKLIETYAHRRRVKPGVTGWAQINGCRGETKSIKSMADRVAFDLWYVENWSVWLDLKILARTIKVAMSQDNAY